MTFMLSHAGLEKLLGGETIEVSTATGHEPIGLALNDDTLAKVTDRRLLEIFVAVSDNYHGL